MNHFLVYFREPLSPDKREEIESERLIDGLYLLSDTTILIRSEVKDPRLLATMLGMKGEEPIAGVALKLNGSYGGYFSKTLWLWLREGRDEAE